MRYLSIIENYYSPLAPEALLKRVQLATTSARAFVESDNFPSTRKVFWGKVGVETFKIRRILWYHNTMQPYIKGWVEPVLDGTCSELRLRYQVPTWLLTVQALTMTVIIGLAVQYLVVSKSATGPWPHFAGFALLLLFFGGGIRAFRNEIHDSRKALIQLLALEKAVI